MYESERKEAQSLINNLKSPNPQKHIVGLPYYLLHEIGASVGFSDEEQIFQALEIPPAQFEALSNNFELSFQKEIKAQAPPLHIPSNGLWKEAWEQQGEIIIEKSRNRLRS